MPLWFILWWVLSFFIGGVWLFVLGALALGDVVPNRWFVWGVPILLAPGLLTLLFLGWVGWVSCSLYERVNP